MTKEYASLWRKKDSKTPFLRAFAVALVVFERRTLWEYLKIQEVAPKWGVSTRNVQMLCAAGKIPGAVRFGRDWMIPKDAPKPADGRSRAARFAPNDDMPLPRKTPFLYMSDLYRIPGSADEAGADGADGKDGVDGLNGVDGKDGENGKDGVAVAATVIGSTSLAANAGWIGYELIRRKRPNWLEAVKGFKFPWKKA